MLPGMVCVRGLRGALDTLSEVGGSGIKRITDPKRMERFWVALA